MDLKNMPSRLHARIKQRPDTEFQQAVVRLIIVSIGFAYFEFHELLGNGAPNLLHIKWVLRISLLVSLALVFAPVFRPNASVLRRMAGMTQDFATASLLLIFGDQSGIPFIGVYLWVTLGNGFRYGVRYLLASLGFALAGFAAVNYFSPYWNSRPYLWWGMLVTIVAVSGYTAFLVKHLHDAIRRAKEASSAKSEFLAKMSHELRTPLNGVIGVADLLVATKLDGEQKELVKFSHASATALLGLIDNILDISRIESGKLVTTTEDFDLLDLARSVAITMEPQAQMRGLKLGLELSGQVPARVNGDSRHLRQVLINLIGNAIKFTERGRVTLRLTQPDPASITLVRFEIADTGIGIPEDARQKIFEAFTQADRSITRKYGGSGLGTAIAKSLVESMGGEIGVSSQEGMGTTFWFDLPFARSSDIPEWADTDWVEAYKNVPVMKILVADDNMVNRRVVRGILENLGHTVKTANDGEETLEALDSELFDLAIIDMHMPVMSGPDVVKRWRMIEMSDNPIPIIMLTADARMDAQTESLDAGVDVFLTKPIGSAQLVDAIAKLAGARPPVSGAGPTAKRVPFARADAILYRKPLDDMGEIGGSPLVRSVAEAFIDDTDNILREARRAALLRDHDGWKRQMHALKGSARDVGALKLGHLAMEAEEIKFPQMFSPIPAAKLEEIRRANDEALSELMGYLDEAWPTDAAAEASAALRAG